VTAIRAAVVICTRNRPLDVAKACEAACRDGQCRILIVVDASSDDETEKVLAHIGQLHSLVEVHYVRADKPGLAKQRNQGAAYCRSLGVTIMHFIDDDTEVLPDYFGAIEARFADDPTLAGVGGIIENQPTVPVRLLKRAFGLWSPYQGSILRSGRNVDGQFPNVLNNGRAPQYLCGCSMSYRTEIVLHFRFDDRLEGYSLGEDFDFGYRVSRDLPLAFEPSARCLHHLTPVNRLTAEKNAYLRTVVVYSWVLEHRSDGMSVGAFWWSVLGDLLLHAAAGLFIRRGSGMQQAKGILLGIITIVAGRATISAE